MPAFCLSGRRGGAVPVLQGGPRGGIPGFSGGVNFSLALFCATP